MTFNVHVTAEVSPHAEVGAGRHLWHHAQAREGARLRTDCIFGKGAKLDFEVEVGSNVKIRSHALVYHGATVEDRALIDPHACLPATYRFPPRQSMR